VQFVRHANGVAACAKLRMQMTTTDGSPAIESKRAGGATSVFLSGAIRTRLVGAEVLGIDECGCAIRR